MTTNRGKRRRNRPRPSNQGPERVTNTRVRRNRPTDGRRRRGVPVVPLLIGGAVIVGLILVVAFMGMQPGEPAPTPARTPGAVAPPEATPLANPPAQPAGDGTTATIETELGDIVIELYNESSPVAAQNFINLAEADYYNGVVFHRIVPGFVIQGGDPEGTGSGGPGYGIPDEPVVGEYVRGTVAMARTPAPNSQGSQFFIVLDDSVREQLPKEGGYAIFGRVTQGMDVVDQIAAGEASQQMALDPVAMEQVAIERP
jgi:peptidyl-prolyl cis-trans isomerase B (cyclophilin B)